MALDAYAILSLVHIFVLGPFLLAIGFGYIPAYVTLGFGAVVILYHLYKYFAVRASWINLFHAFVLGPALLAAGALPAQRWPRELVLMLGFAAIGYHAYYLVRGD